MWGRVMDILLKAKEFATKWHQGQMSESGIPYVMHPIWVADHLDSELDKIVGYLHDILEDTDVSEEEIEKEFGSNVLEILKILTKQNGEDYLTYIDRVRQNDVASRVKICDLKHNMDLSRKINITDYDYFRINNKYIPAYRMLTGHSLSLNEQINTNLTDFELIHLIWNLYCKRLKDDRITRNMQFILNRDSYAVSDELKTYLEGVLNNEVLCD